MYGRSRTTFAKGVMFLTTFIYLIVVGFCRIATQEILNDSSRLSFVNGLAFDQDFNGLEFCDDPKMVSALSWESRRSGCASISTRLS